MNSAPEPGVRLHVSVARQEMEVWDGSERVATYRVSTAERGTGCEPGSLRTPLGRHRVAFKLGGELPEGAILKGREWTGDIWREGDVTDEDLVLTRVLWLEGIEAENASTFPRYIYVHGTNQPGRIGTPASHGCVRLANADMIRLFDTVPVGTPVEIVE